MASLSAQTVDVPLLLSLAVLLLGLSGALRLMVGAVPAWPEAAVAEAEAEVVAVAVVQEGGASLRASRPRVLAADVAFDVEGASVETVARFVSRPRWPDDLGLAAGDTLTVLYDPASPTTVAVPSSPVATGRVLTTYLRGLWLVPLGTAGILGCVAGLVELLIVAGQASMAPRSKRGAVS